MYLQAGYIESHVYRPTRDINWIRAAMEIWSTITPRRNWPTHGNEMRHKIRWDEIGSFDEKCLVTIYDNNLYRGFQKHDRNLWTYHDAAAPRSRMFAPT